MISENYAKAYKEVIEVLKYTKRADVNKIPIYRILLWKTNMKKDYDFKIDPSKKIEDQNLSAEARAIIANIFKKYWATDEQRQRIEAKQKYDLEQIEIEKKAKYNYDNLFKNRKNNTTYNEEKNENAVDIVEYKESWIKKILSKIKSLFIR